MLTSSFYLSYFSYDNYTISLRHQIDLDARIPKGMEKEGDLTEALKDIKNVGGNTSWFRDTPHYWAEASLPFAYALACVEVVCKSSEKARILYNLL
jgi:hypothetical protein